MNTERITPRQWDDVVFENRNKEYGAYFIRRTYGDYILIALLINLLIIALVLGFPAIQKLFTPSQEEEKVVLKTVKYTDLAPPPPIDKNTPPPPKLDVPPPVKKIIKFLPPKITDKEVEEEKMPTVEEIKQNETGAEDIEGDDQVVFDEPVAEVVNTTEDENQVFMVVEQSPEFEGGLQGMVKYLKKNLRYPAKAQRMSIEGTVFIGFIVNKDGNISDVTVIKGIDNDCDKEAVRVVEKMPPWKPGKQNGRAVRVRFVLPIKFHLDV